MAILSTMSRAKLATFASVIWCVLFVFMPALAGAAGSITLAWDAPPGATGVTYKLYDGFVSRVYTNVVPVGSATSVTVTSLVTGATYYFAVTATDASGLESDYSAELAYANLAAPAIVLSAPADGASYTAPATINLAANVATNGHSITEVQFYNGVPG
jgi:hypothetical protein